MTGCRVENVGHEAGPPVGGHRARIVGQYFQRQLAATKLARPLPGPGQQGLGDALAAPAGMHHDVMHVEQRFGGEGGETGEAVDQPDRLAIQPGQCAMETGHLADGVHQMELGVIGQALATPHRVAGVVIEQVEPGFGLSRVIQIDGRNVQATHGLETTLAELAEETPEFRDQVREWCRALVSHLVLDDRRLVVAHAGLKEAYHGRASGRVRSFALYGDTTGETDEYGLPVRYPWAEEYRGRATVVYGHTPTPVLEWVNNTLCLDTGCVFGGSLSAMRYPEQIGRAHV